MEKAREKLISRTKNTVYPLEGRTITRTSLLAILCVAAISALANVHTADASIQAYDPLEFSGDGAEFYHFAIDERTGSIYIGGRDVLYHLNGDLSLSGEEDTRRRCPGLCYNDNRVLVLAPDPVNRLITCGSNPKFIKKQASCELRKLTNISDSLPSPYPMINSKTSAVGVLGPDTNLFLAVSPQFDPEGNFVHLTKWLVNPMQMQNPFESKGTLIDQLQDTTQFGFQVNFMDGFVQNGFSYFTANQQQLIAGGSGVNPPNDYPFVSKIYRVCQADTSENLGSYAEVGLSCLRNGTRYNLIQAMGVSEPGRTIAEAVGSDSNILYAVFATGSGNTGTPEPDSVLCMYTLSDIEDKFLDTVKKCLTGAAGDYGSKHLPSGCSNLSPDAINLDVARGHLCDSEIIYPSAADPLEAEAILHMDGKLATSIQTAVEEKETVAFVGTDSGDLLKVHIGSPTQARIYEKVSIDESKIQPDTYFNKTSDQIYLLTEQKLVRLSVANCSQYTTCEDCIGVSGAEDGDPYCGWCTLEARCTRYRDCERMSEPRRWLPYSAEECSSIVNTSLGFSVPITTPSTEINITVSQLPALSEGSSYVCHFGDFTSQATPLDGQLVNCNTPPRKRIPDIPVGQAHVTVALSIYSTETSQDFVTRDFEFYECSLMQSCSQCMSSAWACDWCIYDNKCTHDHTTCQEGNTTIFSDDPDAVSKCPRILVPSERLFIPAGSPREIRLQAANLPTDPEKVSGYKCVLSVEGEMQETPAEFVNASTVLCRSKVFTYSSEAIGELNAELDVLWNSVNKVDDDDITVTLYKCEVDRDSCSRCLSPARTAPVLQCQWCGEMCSVSDSNQCTTHNALAVCGAPRIENIMPRSGPLEGNTVITVSGTDLGQAFSNVSRIMIGSSECSLNGMESSYDPGRSVQCLTSESRVGEYSVTIFVNTKNGTGRPRYEYVDPMVASFTPNQGLAAGGTQITVTGKHLNTGSNQTAKFGNTSCIFEGDLTSSQASCRTSDSSSDSIPVPLTMTFDGAVRTSSQTFTFLPNPTITAMSRTKSIKAGGLRIVVTGTGFVVLQQATIRITVEGDSGQGCSSEQPCQLCKNITCGIKNITCTTPAFPKEQSCTPGRKRRATDPTPLAMANVSFILDGYTISSPDRRLEYFPNPVYDNFEGGVQEFSATNIIIKGTNLNAASSKDDVLVMVGNSSATVVSLASEALVFDPPKEIPALAEGENSTKYMRMVVVKHGALTFRIGQLDYSAQAGPGSQMMIFIIVGVLASIVLVIVLVIVLCCVMSQRRFKQRLERVQLEMQELENSVKTEATKAFFDIQQDMSGIKDQLQDVGGMPFVTNQDYVRNMLFVGLDMQPLTQDPQLPEENLTKAMLDFAKLLSNKDFLLVFIRALDEDKKLNMREKNNIASLLTVALVMEGKLAYLSEVMLTLMSESILNAAESDRYRQLFRRTESIVEKLLANWMALCMYKYLHTHAASPLYLLYQAIKFQVEKGPIDVITSQCHYSLNYDYLLDEDVDFKEVTLEVENKMQDSETNHVKVLDVDTISQVKEKVLDALLRNKPQSERFTPMDVDVVLRSGFKGQLVLRDTDNTTEKPIPRWAKVNTIQHYGIMDDAKVAVVNKQDNPNASLATPLDEDTELLPSPTASPKRVPVALERAITNVESDLEEGFQFFHLSPLYEDDASKKKKKGKSMGGSQVTHRRIREIYLRRLVTTKKSIQTFVDDALKVMLSVSANRPLPKALKYLFDFLDRQADRQKLKTDTSELWKNSCLPLRFWVTALTHPSYVFDMHQTRTVDTCISVLTQMLDNACKGIVPKYSFETSPSRVLYASELPNYIKMIPKFYEDIKDLPRVNQEEVDEEFREVCEAFHGTFSNIGTLNQLYKLATARNDTLIEALEEDEQCQRANMVYKWECIGETLSQGGD